MKIKYLILFFFFVLSSCAQKTYNTDLQVSIEKSGDLFKFKLNFNIKRLGCLYFDPLILKNFFDSKRQREVDSIINSVSNPNRISELFNYSTLILENQKGQRKVFKVDYNIINGKRSMDLSILFYKKYIIEICYPKFSHYDLVKDIYTPNELKVKKGDTCVRLMYIYGNQIKSKKRVLFSNWIKLKND